MQDVANGMARERARANRLRRVLHKAAKKTLAHRTQLRLPQEWRLVQRQVRQLRAQLNGNR